MYAPNPGTPGNLINIGATAVLPAGDDALLLLQNTVYAQQASDFITKVSAPISRVNEKQKYLLSILNSTYMTLAQAQSYFPGATAIYWSNGVVDYRAGLAAIIAAEAAWS